MSRRFATWFGGLVVLSLLVASAAVAKPPPPPADDFAGAPALVGPLPIQVPGPNDTFTTNNFTSEPGEPNHAGKPGGASGWYSWTPPDSGPVEIDTCGSDFNTLLAVYTGTAVGALDEVASNDDSCAGQSKAEFTAIGGVKYWIAIDGVDGAQGTLELTLRNVPPADNFADATRLPADHLSIEVTGSNTNLTKEPGEPNHAGNPGGASGWYRWTPSGSDIAVVETCDSDFNTVLAVYTGEELGSLREVESNNNSCGNQSLLGFSPDPGTTYWIAVDGVGGSEGSLVLTIREQHEALAIIRPLVNVLNDMLTFFHDDLGLGWGMAIILLTVVTRALLIPLTYRQIKGMRAMQALAPQIKEIQEKYKNDRQRQQQEMMRFYQVNKINPLSACLPLLLQLPVFFSLFYLLRGDEFKVELGGAGWLGLPNLSEPATGAALVVLLALFVGSMAASTLVTQVPTSGRSQQYMLAGVFSLMGFFFVPTFPSGLSVYWITTNVWTVGQQFVVQKVIPAPHMATPEEVKAAKPPPPPPRKKKKRR